MCFCSLCVYVCYIRGISVQAVLFNVFLLTFRCARVYVYFVIEAMLFDMFQLHVHVWICVYISLGVCSSVAW